MTLTAPVPRLELRGRALALERPALMGIVNASPDSFSDGGEHASLAAQLELAHALVEDGAALVDLGGQSGITGVPEVPVAEEIARVAPLVAAVAAQLPDVVVSVDTYRPEVAAAVLDAGAHLVNDVSGLLYPEVAACCAAYRAGLVVMHTRARPKEKVLDPHLYPAGVTADVVSFLRDRVAAAVEHGVAENAIVVDPGPDFAKTPHQTVTVLRELDAVFALGRPVLLALSRKDFVGAITRRRPRGRLGGTLGAVAAFTGRAGVILRVHDVAAVADFLAVDAVLRGDRDVPEDLTLPVELRREP